MAVKPSSQDVTRFADMLSAMGNLNPSRLLDPRYLDVEGGADTESELFPLITEAS